MRFDWMDLEKHFIIVVECFSSIFKCVFDVSCDWKFGLAGRRNTATVIKKFFFWNLHLAT